MSDASKSFTLITTTPPPHLYYHLSHCQFTDDSKINSPATDFCLNLS